MMSVMLRQSVQKTRLFLVVLAGAKSLGGGRLLGQKHRVDVGQHAALGDGDVAEQFV